MEDELLQVMTEMISHVIAQVDYDIWKFYEYGEGATPEGFSGLADMIIHGLSQNGFEIVKKEEV